MSKVKRYEIAVKELNRIEEIIKKEIESKDFLRDLYKLGYTLANIVNFRKEYLSQENVESYIIATNNVIALQ